MVSVKKRRVNKEEAQPNSKFTSSKIFAPFRTVGLVTDGVPLAVTSLGQSFTITTSVGRSFQIFDASTLHLLFVSTQTPENITCLVSHFQHVFAAWGHTVGIFKRGRLEVSVDLETDGKIVNMIVFGEYLCVATSAKVFVYKFNTKDPKDCKLYTSYKVPKMLGNVNQLVHMPTYLNKIMIVTDNLLVLYNVRSGKVIHSFDGFEDIAFVEPAPVLDVVAVATKSGKVHIFNIKKGIAMFELSLDERITTLSFRTDGTAHLGVGTAAGHLFFYDLNTKKRIHSVRNAHDEASGGVAHLEFLSAQPIVVSNGGDNLVQELVFDPTITNSNTAITTPPRVLRSRGGHSRPPSCVSFTDEEGHFLLSASQDQSLWSFSLRKDSQSHEFSQRQSKKKVSQLHEKFPEITHMAYQADKQNRWDNILTAHKDSSFARTWSGARGIVGNYNLNTLDGGIVKSVCITQCGNFALVGSSLGSIAVYSMQSGILRRRVSKAHTKAITGLTVDALNKTIISVSLDGKLALHDFKTGRLINTVKLESSATDLRIHGSLVAVALDNLSIVVVDIATRRVVRELWGHANRITSYDFTPDGRWIISAALDSTIRTWDLPSGGCIDAVRVPSVVTSLRISPTGEWLATAHVQGVGVQLWTQRSQFTRSTASRHINQDEINSMEMPTVSGENGANILEGAFDDAQDGDSSVYVSKSDQLDQSLLTLSKLPRAKYNTLVHLDVIKMRNKPTEAPKKPAKLPFFLGASANGDAVELEKDEDQLSNRVPAEYQAESKFTRLLRDGDPQQLIAHLKELSPSATDMEIRSLNTTLPLPEFNAFIYALTNQLQLKKDYEFVQAWMAMLLRVHGDVILAHGGLLEDSLKAWEHEQRREAVRLEALVKYCSGVLSYLRAL